MIRVIPTDDIIVNITFINDDEKLDKIEFKFYTTSINNFVKKTEKDIVNNTITITYDEWKKLDEGVLMYDIFSTSTISKNECLTNYYLYNPIKWGKIKGDIQQQKDMIELINQMVNKAIKNNNEMKNISNQNDINNG